MRLFALILAWLAWALLLNATLTGPMLFLFNDPPKSDGDLGAIAAFIWSAFFSGVVSIALLICSRFFFDGKTAGILRSWQSVLAFLLCRLTGLLLLAGAIVCASLSANREDTLNGWIGVAVGFAALIYTARHPKELPTKTS